MFVINIGGEGEEPGVLNQQPYGALGPNWKATHMPYRDKTLYELAATGVPFLICPNDALSLPDNSVDVVYTNNVPYTLSNLGVGVQESEIKRILKSGGVWLRDRVPYFVKP